MNINHSTMLTRGNSKLGNDIYVFSLPRIVTCPGRTPWCTAHCYMEPIEKRWINTLDKYFDNLGVAQSYEFVGRMVAEIEDKRVKILRIHVDGDFFSVQYIKDWIRIVEACPEVVFYGYTHSWRVPNLLPHLLELRRHTNMWLRASVDPDTTTLPEVIWPIAEVACMIHEFTYWCPMNFNNPKKTTCSQCQVCFSQSVHIHLNEITKLGVLNGDVPMPRTAEKAYGLDGAMQLERQAMPA